MSASRSSDTVDTPNYSPLYYNQPTETQSMKSAPFTIDHFLKMNIIESVQYILLLVAVI
jgi:hypothetical protein